MLVALHFLSHFRIYIFEYYYFYFPQDKGNNQNNKIINNTTINYNNRNKPSQPNNPNNHNRRNNHNNHNNHDNHKNIHRNNHHRKPKQKSPTKKDHHKNNHGKNHHCKIPGWILEKPPGYLDLGSRSGFLLGLLVWEKPQKLKKKPWAKIKKQSNTKSTAQKKKRRKRFILREKSWKAAEHCRLESGSEPSVESSV